MYCRRFSASQSLWSAQWRGSSAGQMKEFMAGSQWKSSAINKFEFWKLFINARQLADCEVDDRSLEALGCGCSSRRFGI